MGRLDRVDLTRKLDKEDSEKRLEAAQERLTQLRLTLGGLIGDGELGPPVCVAFEGWDASGKGGAIKRLVMELDPRHVHVKSFSAPDEREKRHHFLWRFWPHLPGWGGMSVFDRTWYGRVLVERVEGFATPEEWERAYGEINAFEAGLVSEGVVLIKLWLHVSDAEQLKRFEARKRNPLKAWKLTDEDWRNREKRREYEQAVEDMLDRTGTDAAPWDVIPGDSKHYARVAVLETAIARIEEGMRREGIEPPPALGGEAR